MPDKNCLNTLRVLIIVTSLVLMVAVGYFITVSLLVTLINTIIGAWSFFMMFTYLPIFIKSINYTDTGSEIIMSCGVIMKIQKAVKYSSVQYVTVITTPFSQYTGMNFIFCFVYGGQLRLIFLNHNDALEILEKINTKGENADVP